MVLARRHPTSLCAISCISVHSRVLNRELVVKIKVAAEERIKSESPAFAMIVCAKNYEHVFDQAYGSKGPENETENS